MGEQEKKVVVAVSACLLGENCKYNGGNNRCEELLEWLEDKEVISVCPEVLGGLSTPRPPAEIVNGTVTNTEGRNVQREFQKGTEIALEIVRKNHIDLAVLQSRSPSCGVEEIYDGSFSKTLKKGQGMFAKWLMEEGYKVLDVSVFKRNRKEQIALVSGVGAWHTRELKNLPSIQMSDGPHGLRKQDEEETQNNNSYVATCFPTASATACSFDSKLIARMAKAIATEAIAEEVSIVLGPGVNMKRSPLCGRNFEYFSEDPYLAGVLASSYINAMQDTGVGCSLKHFAANNQETRRQLVDSRVSSRTLREYYLPAFEYAVKNSQPATVMASYNQINGVFACENKTLLTDILRKEWGFRGAVISDWGACVNLPESILAGMDLEMPDSHGAHQKELEKWLEELSDTKELEACLERASRNVERLVRSYPVKAKKPPYSIVAGEEHHQLAREISAKSAVLLKNNGILPLRNKRVLVIGEMAKTMRYQGGGSSHINVRRSMDVITALQSQGFDVIYTPGYGIQSDKLEQKKREAALQLAKEAESIIFCGGLTEEIEGEGFDRKNLEMSPNQKALIEELVEVNEHVVYVSFSGAPYLIPAREKLAAILQMYLGGQGEADALVDILSGKVCPSGKLAETWPLSLKDTPCYGNFATQENVVDYKENMLVGYRHYTTGNIPVQYCFGYGLSYTTFQYNNLAIEKLDTEGVKIAVKVKNTGTVTGEEVVQLYVKTKDTEILRPLKELRGFKKIELKPGEEKEVEFELSMRAFSLWSIEKNAFVVVPGTYEIVAGHHVLDEELALEVEIQGEQQQITDEVVDFHASRLQEERDQKKTDVYTMRSSIGQLAKHSMKAAILKKAAPHLLRFMYHGKPTSDPEVRMALEMVLEGSIDSVSSQSGGILTYENAQKIVEKANRKEKRGHGKIK